MPTVDMPIDPHKLYTPTEAASLFRVDSKTVSRWSRDGKLPAIRTLGGHRRFLGSVLLRALNEGREG